MDQDFYIEESSPLKVILTIVLFLGLIGGGLYYYFNYHKETTVKLKNLTVELGNKLPTNINDYIECSNPATYKLDISSIKVDDNGNAISTGEYSYKVIKNNEIKKGKVFVKDTTKPNVVTTDLFVGVKEEFSPNDFISSCDDLSLPCTVKYKNISDENLNDNEGTYTINIIISDAEGNSVTKIVSLIVSGENTLANKKANDLEYDHLSEIDDNWDKSYTMKLDKAIVDSGINYNELFEELSSKEYDFDKEITDKRILVIYNKYNYVLGFSIKYTFSDSSYIYVTKENAKEKASE